MSEYIQNDVKSQESASILQISNYCQNRVLIIDFFKIKKDKEFFDLFKTNLKFKILVMFSIKLILSILSSFLLKCKMCLNMMK